MKIVYNYNIFPSCPCFNSLVLRSIERSETTFSRWYFRQNVFQNDRFSESTYAWRSSGGPLRKCKRRAEIVFFVYFSVYRWRRPLWRFLCVSLVFYSHKRNSSLPLYMILSNVGFNNALWQPKRTPHLLMCARQKVSFSCITLDFAHCVSLRVGQFCTFFRVNFAWHLPHLSPLSDMFPRAFRAFLKESNLVLLRVSHVIN